MLPENPTLKHGATLIIVFVLIMSVLSVAPSGVVAQQQPAHETEPNDAPQGGTPVSSTQMNGTLDPARADMDWFVLTVQQGETIEATIDFAAVESAEFEVSLLSPTGKQLDFASESSQQVGVAAVAPRTGTYFIGVSVSFYSDAKNPPKSIPYTLTVSPVSNTTPPSYTGTPNLSQQPQPEQEPNDFQENATRVRGAPISGTIQSTKDNDWVAIRAEEGERIEAIVVFENIDDNTYIRMSMRTPNGTYLAPMTGVIQTDRRMEIATIAPQTGTYYIKLSANYAPPNTNYTFTVFSVGHGPDTTTTSTTFVEKLSQSIPAPSTVTAVDPSTTNITINYPPGYSASGIADPRRASIKHLQALVNRSSYTFTENRTKATSSILTWESRTLKVNTTTNLAYKIEDFPENKDSIYTYHTKKIEYVRSLFGFEISYSARPSPFSMFYNKSLPTVYRYLANGNFGEAKLVKRNGETLIRYRATKITGHPRVFYVSPDKMDDVTDFSMTVLVDQSGIVKSLSYTTTIKKEDGTLQKMYYRFHITGLNSTSIRKPSWLNEAKANTTVQTPITTTKQMTPTSALTSTPSTETTPTSAEDGQTNGANSSNGTVPAGNTTGGNGSGGSGTSGPGFGAAVAIVALLAIALLTTRRQAD